MNRHGMVRAIATVLAALWIGVPAGSAVAQPATDVEGVKAASAAFYSALAALDRGAAMSKVWAQTSYVTFAGPRSRSVLVGWDAQKQYWLAADGLFVQRDVKLVEPQIHVNGSLAWEMGPEVGDAKLANGQVLRIDNLVTNVYEKTDGRWLMVSHHALPKPE